MRQVGSVAGVLRRSRDLTRVVGAYSLFKITESAAWLTILVFAFQRGGAAEAGLVAVAQLLPAAALAPWLSARSDRGSPVAVLVIAYSVQAASLGTAAVAAVVGAPGVLYPSAVVASTAFVAIRPAQAALLPRLAASAAELTAANVVIGWIESAALVVAGLMTGALLAAAGVYLVLAVTGALVVGSVALLRPLRRISTEPLGQRGQPTSVLEGLHIVRVNPAPRLLVAVLTAEWIIVGALDVLFVVLAIDIIGREQELVGYLQTAFGVGGIAAGVVTGRLVGRRLGPPMLASGAVLSVALGLIAAQSAAASSMVLLGVVGAGRAVLDVAARTLLQRAVPPNLLGRIFGVLEGCSMVGLATGSLLVPLLIHFGDARLAFIGVALVLPLIAVLGSRSVLRLDFEAAIPTVEIALLRASPLFRDLPPPELEGLAGVLKPIQLGDGTILIREGDSGDDYYIIASGGLDISREGRPLRRLSRGQGVGEIALLRGGPRTATVTAHGPATVYQLGRDPFLAAVTGHASAHSAVDSVVDHRLRDVEPPS